MIWRHSLNGEKCEVFTYDKSLKYLFMQKELNIRWWELLELLKDYDLTISYHPGKVKIVVDAIRRMASQVMASTLPKKIE